MELTCIIIEDQTPAQRLLKKYISDYGKLTVIGVFSDAIQALQFLKETKVDLIFLDIHLPKISGIDFLKSLPNPPAVILTTAFSDYAVQSYELDVLDYLVKPFSFERFSMALAKLIPLNGNGPTNDSIEFYVKAGYEYVKINSRDILYFRSDMNYTEIHLDGKKHLTQDTLQYWQEKLEKLRFSRVHKSYLVNTEYVTKLVSNKIYLSNKEQIPLGRAYKDDFKQRFLE